MNRCDLRVIQGVGAALLAVFVLALPGAAAADGAYLRVDLGWIRSGDTRFEDVNCAQTNPPALFGCQNGSDGQPIGAPGDFGDSPAIELGVGRRFLPWLRAELLLSYVPNLDFSGSANFLNVSGAQPVNGEAESLAAFAVAWVDLPAIGRWRPYIGLGAGAVRNHSGEMTYAFPGLGAGALTRTGGGTETGFAWFASVGVAWSVTERTSLDFALRYSDLGEVGTDSGSATVVRSSGSRTIAIGATRAKLTVWGLLLGLRYRF